MHLLRRFHENDLRTQRKREARHLCWAHVVGPAARIQSPVNRSALPWFSPFIRQMFSSDKLLAGIGRLPLYLCLAPHTGAHSLMSQLGIDLFVLIEAAYVDLLGERAQLRGLAKAGQ
jgi:hypothetical protein